MKGGLMDKIQWCRWRSSFRKPVSGKKASWVISTMPWEAAQAGEKKGR